LPSGCGTFFRVTPGGFTSFTVLHSFDGPTGAHPFVSPMQHTNGKVYADPRLGGTGSAGSCPVGSCGVVVSWNPAVPPFVRAVTNSGRVGNSIGLLGELFTGATAVRFNGQLATFTVSSATYMTAIVPAGATTGNVTVTVQQGILTTNKKFRVTPQITSFTPSSGPVGTVVTIIGVSLTQTTKITFGGVAATTFTVNSDTKIMVTVPSGAVSGKIVVTTAGGTAASSASFTVT